jgi:hypothetical protein
MHATQQAYGNVDKSQIILSAWLSSVSSCKLLIGLEQHGHLGRSTTTHRACQAAPHTTSTNTQLKYRQLRAPPAACHTAPKTSPKPFKPHSQQ